MLVRNIDHAEHRSDYETIAHLKDLMSLVPLSAETVRDQNENNVDREGASRSTGGSDAVG